MRKDRGRKQHGGAFQRAGAGPLEAITRAKMLLEVHVKHQASRKPESRRGGTRFGFLVARGRNQYFLTTSGDNKTQTVSINIPEYCWSPLQSEATKGGHGEGGLRNTSEIHCCFSDDRFC